MLDGTLLTLRAHHDAEDLVRAYRVLCGDSLGSELVTSVALAGNSPGNEDSQTDDDSVLTWEQHPESEWLGAELRMGRRKASSVRSIEVRIQSPEADPHCNAPHGNRESLASGLAQDNGLMSPLSLPPQMWDVSEVDIGRVFPRVVSHRLRVRSGPDDEILGSIMHPAVRTQSPSGIPLAERQSVKQIIVGILADV
jgi:hypothetical protein